MNNSIPSSCVVVGAATVTLKLFPTNNTSDDISVIEGNPSLCISLGVSCYRTTTIIIIMSYGNKASTVLLPRRKKPSSSLTTRSTVLQFFCGVVDRWPPPNQPFHDLLI